MSSPTNDDQDRPIEGTSGRPAPKVRPEQGALQVELISIGSDLVRGRVADANARVVAEALTQRGARVGRITVIDDQPESIEHGLREVLGRSPNLVVTSGGLGPAPDDRTLAALAEILGAPLSLNPVARSMVESAYQRMARSRLTRSGGMNAARQKMCRIPVGSTPVENTVGVAPGIVFRLAGGTAIVCLPGRPDEAKATFAAALEEIKDLMPKSALAQREVESPTSDESELRALLEMIAREFPEVWISSHPPRSRKKGAAFVITLEASAPTVEAANLAVSTAQRRLLALAAGAV